RLSDPTLFRNEILAQYPHVSFTIYDETAVALHKLTGLSFRNVLEAEQIVFRACEITGVYLLGLSVGLSIGESLLVTAIFTLGATIVGPAVLTFEYEPVPRGFSVGLLFLALGLLAYGQHRWAGIVAGIGLLYHVPAAYPFWGMYLAM